MRSWNSAAEEKVTRVTTHSLFVGTRLVRAVVERVCVLQLHLIGPYRPLSLLSSVNFVSSFHCFAIKHFFFCQSCNMHRDSALPCNAKSRPVEMSFVHGGGKRSQRNYVSVAAYQKCEPRSASAARGRLEAVRKGERTGAPKPPRQPQVGNSRRLRQTRRVTWSRLTRVCKAVRPLYTSLERDERERARTQWRWRARRRGPSDREVRDEPFCASWQNRSAYRSPRTKKNRVASQAQHSDSPSRECSPSPGLFHG